MRALKGLLIYIGLVLGIFVGISLILLCIMYFVPSFRIAGYGIVHFSRNVEAQSIELSEYNTGSFELNISSNKVNIKVVPSSSNNITYDMKLSVFGISSEIVEYKVNKKVEKVDGVLKVFITISEPNGWISSSDSVVNISVPTNKSINLIVNTNSGNVSVGGEERLNFNLIDVTTESGDFTLSNVSSNLSGISLSTNKGKFDLSSIENITFANKMVITSLNGSFKFGNINGSVEITGNSISMDAGVVNCGSDGFNCIGKSVILNISKINSPEGVENTIIAENLYIKKLGELSGKTGIVTTYGDINITTIKDYTMISDDYGNVNIGTAEKTISITTYIGNIYVNDYKEIGRFTSDRGDITVKNTSEFVKGYYTEINNVDGNVKVRNNVNRLQVITTGRSNVDVIFVKIKEDEVFTHDIQTSLNGNCNVYIQTDAAPPFMFIADGIISGSIEGANDIPGLSHITASTNPQYFYPNPGSADNTPAEAEKNANFHFYGRICFHGAFLDVTVPSF